jgi:hypothetical protein
MRRIAGLSNKKPLKKPAAKVRKAPPRAAGRRRKAARKRPARQLFTNDLFGAVFKTIAPQELKVWSRHFPAHMRADLQTPLDALMASADYCVGAMPRYRSETLTMTTLMNRAADDRVEIGPIAYAEVDVGEDDPVRCAMNTFILRHEPLPHAIFISAGNDPTEDKVVRVEIAVPRDHPDGQELASKVLRPFSDAIAQARAYRGKVLSLEKQEHYSGRVGAIQVHRMKRVDPSDVILPAPTRQLIDHCVLDFMKTRGQPEPWLPDQARHPALWPARDRQDPHHPLSGQQPARHHHLPHHCRAGRPDAALHESRAPAAAVHGGDRGCRPDRPLARPHAQRLR